MIEIHSQISHQLGQSAAVHRMHELVGSLPQRFPQQVHQVKLLVQDHSVEVSFAAYGYLVHWKADVQEDCILLQGKIPDSAKKFKNKMEQTIVNRVATALELANSLQRKAA